MRTYRRGWLALVCLLGGLGALEAALAVPWPVILAAAVISGGACCVAEDVLSRRPAGTAPRPRAVTVVAGAGAGAGLAGLDAMLGSGAALLLALAMLAGSPLVLLSAAGLGRRAYARAVPAEVSRPPTRPSPSSLERLSDAELCWAWRLSYAALEALGTGQDTGGRSELVSTRQRYLDELERRNPAGFRRWLYAGARPASDPAPYLAWAQRRG